MYGQIVESSNASNYTIDKATVLSLAIASQFVGVLSVLTAIILILVSRAHKNFLYRLLLYWAVSGLALLISGLLSLIQSYYVFIISNFVFTYSILAFYLFLWWIVFYLFLLAVFRVQLNKTKHKIIGLVIALTAPLTIAWVVPWIIASEGVSNIFEYTKHSWLVVICIIYTPSFVSILSDTLTIVAVSVHLYRGAQHRNDTYSLLYMKALKEALLFLSYLVLHQTVMFVCFVLIIWEYFNLQKKGTSIAIFVLYSTPCFFVFLPVFVLCQPRVRHNLKMMCKRASHPEISQTHTVHQSSATNQQTSATQFVVSPEASFTEHDQLIIKQ